MDAASLLSDSKEFKIPRQRRPRKRYCYALSIFRDLILLASSDNDKSMLMRQKTVNKDSPK